MIVQKYRKSTKMQRSVWDEKEFVNERGTEAIKDLLDKAYKYASEAEDPVYVNKISALLRKY